VDKGWTEVDERFLKKLRELLREKEGG